MFHKNKTKTQKARLKLILAGLLFFTSISLSHAWGPATEPHWSGITRTTHPAGLPYASFNNFTDNNNPESSLNDERYFVVVKNYTDAGNYMNNVAAWSGDIILALAFIHNNGYLNDPSVTATGVITGMNNFHEEDWAYVTDPWTAITISQYISSNNATPLSVWDEFTVTSKTGDPIRLKAAQSFSIQSDYLGTFFPAIPTDNLFLTGQSIGDPDSGYTSGTFKGCMENAMYTFVYFQVLNASVHIPAPTCNVSVTPASITSGWSSTLTWTSSGATSASIDQWIGTVTLSGTGSVSPTATTTYTMAVTGSGGTATCSDVVTVSSSSSSSSGGSSSSSSSSGGGSSGGGGRPNVSLKINKMISLDGEEYFEADILKNALWLKTAPNSEVFYKVIIDNRSSVILKDMMISDTFFSKTNNIQQSILRNIENATYENGIFNLGEIGKKEEYVFAYRTTLNTQADFISATAYNEVEILDYEISGNSRYRKQVWQKDRAYVALPEIEMEKTLRKYCSKNIIKDGDEVTYTIFFKNEFEYDLKNVVFTDNYDETRIKIISAQAENDGSALKFKRTIIRPGQSVVFRYTVQGINKGESAVKARNVVTIFTNTVDLSNESAEKTITIYPPNKPLPLLQSGPTHLVFIFLAGVFTLFFKRRRKLALTEPF